MSGKVLALGVPHFIFSLAAWLLKASFSESVNSKIDRLFETSFLNLASPCWYLYCLFFIFLVTPTFKNARMTIVGLTLASATKIVSITGREFDVWVWGWGEDGVRSIKITFKRGMVCAWNVPVCSWN